MIFVIPPKPPVIKIKVHSATMGRVCGLILDKNKQPIRTAFPWRKNLILNNGLDQWCSTSKFNALSLYCVAGSGATDTSIDPSPTTAAQSGTTVTLSGGTFVFVDTATDAGKTLKWSGNEARIVTVTDPTHAEVTPSQTVADSAFLVYFTQQSGLVSEVKRTNTYLAGAGNTETTYPGNTIQNRRTYDFAAEVGSQSYNELGLSWTGSAGNNLFSRVKTPSQIDLVAGQSLRVVWDLIGAPSPLCSAPQTYGTSPITNWAGATGALGVVNPYGLADLNGSVMGSIEPSDAGWLELANWTSFSWPSFKSVPGGSRSVIYDSPQMTKNVYTTFDFHRHHSLTIPVGSANSSNILVINNARAGSFDGSFFYLIDSAQTKDSLHTLTIDFIFSVGRTLA